MSRKVYRLEKDCLNRIVVDQKFCPAVFSLVMINEVGILAPSLVDAFLF